MNRKSLLTIILVFAFAWMANAQDEWVTIENGTKFQKVVFVQNGATPLKGDIILMKLKKYSPEGLLVFSTDMIDAEHGVEMTLSDDVLDGDILDVFLHLKSGEKAKAIVPVWVADNNIELKKIDSSYYQYEIELIHFKTKLQLEIEQKELLIKLRKEQGLLFDELSSSLYPHLHKVYDKDGLYILKSDASKVKKKHKISSKSLVSVHYKLKLLPTMLELDNSYSRDLPFDFKVDDGQVIKGWDVAFMQLKKGDKAVLLIPSWLAYGFTGSGRDIAPNTPLLFEIEILK